jgi:hypothetical protein
MSGYKKSGRTCGKSEREKNSKFKLPFEARDIDKYQYFNDTFLNALKFHYFSHELAAPYPVARKVLYDIWYDALKNSNDKIHKKNIEYEYANYLDYFNKYLPQYQNYVSDWEAYRKSEMYYETLKTLNEVKRTDHRLQIATDFALSYLYAKYQTRYDYTKLIQKVEQALHLDVITKVWSKTSFWLAVQLLVFDPTNLYANTIGNNKVYVSEFDKEKEEALKIYITPWYEREDVKLSQEWRNLALVYQDVIIPFAGEVGSVGLAEAAKKGTVISLIHLANALTTLASFHPALRTVSTVSKILEFAATFLDKSILAWLGWQIGIEWALDGEIQKVLSEFGKLLYTAITGEPIKKGYFLDSELKELSDAVGLYLKLLNGSGYIDGSDVKLAEWYNNTSLKLRFFFDKIIKTIELKEQLFSLLRKTRFKLIEKKELTEKGFSFVCNPDANNFVKTVNEAIRLYFDKLNYFQKYMELSGINENYLSNVKNVFSDIHSEFLDINLLSIYERYNNENEFGYGNNQEDCAKWYINKYSEPGFSSVGSGYSISCMLLPTGEKLLRFFLKSFVFVYHPLPCSFDFAIMLIIEIRSLSNFNLDDDFYKNLTDCDKIQNIKIALSRLNPDIYINITPSTYENFTKYRESNKLKLRKTKKCVSVKRKVYKVRSKRNPQQTFISFPTMHRKHEIKIEIMFGMYDSLPGKKHPIGAGFSYLTISSFETLLTQVKSDLLQYNINALSEAYQTYNSGLSHNGSVWCPQEDLSPQNYQKEYSQNFGFTFNIHLVNDKTKIDRQKSKRSKIVCIKQ